MYNIELEIDYKNDHEYRETLLKLYNLSEYNEQKMLSMNEEFLNKFSKNIELQKLLEHVSEMHILKTDKYLGLIILIAYNYLPLFYPIVVQLYKEGNIDINNLDSLKKLLH